MALGLLAGRGLPEAMSDFSLILFSTDPIFVRRAVEAGVEAIVVDWERIGKEDRQAAADTQINADTIDDLRAVRASTEATVICRVNQLGPWTAREIDDAIGAGADEILLPMVRTVEEAERALELVKERCRFSILIETVSAAGRAKDFARLPLRRVYVGLNDLAIERQTPSIFRALTDGTLDRVRHAVAVPFGFGGLTAPDEGSPLPCRLLIGEMARLDCQFSFLRRSFHADARGVDLHRLIGDIAEAVRRARSRTPAEVERDREALRTTVAELEKDGTRVSACLR
jgi:hypothetical protein